MTRPVRYVALVTAALLAALVPAVLPATVTADAATTRATRETRETTPPRPGTYRNPLAPTVPGSDRTVDSCADPTVVRGRGAESHAWFMYCTTDPLDDADTAGRAPGDVRFHPVPTMRSTDLVNWTYVGDALPDLPSWAATTAAAWAPDVVWSKKFRRYYLSFVVTDTADSVSGEPGCASDSAIGVATSTSPTGPWTVSDQPVVAPRRAGSGCDFYWTYDPDVLGDVVADRSVLYYGSYYGGVYGRHVRLTRTGMEATGPATRVAQGQRTEPGVDPVRLRRGVSTDPRAQARASALEQVAIGNRYEGTNVVRRGGWYYLFASAGNCCNGPLTGYSVFAGRSRNPLGPFEDREGNSLLAGRVGGTPVISMNGNRWVGTGHNTVFRDRGGQWWTVYHAVDRDAPYFADQPGFTKRPALLDPVDWVDGWPSVRSGRWASDSTMPAPAAQPGQRTAYRPRPVRRDRTGRLLRAYSDTFSGTRLGSRWTWVRPPSATTYAVRAGTFVFRTQAADLNQGTDPTKAPPLPSVLTEPAPKRDFVVQAKVRLDLPPSGCCYNFAQAGLVVYGSDDSYVKLAHVGIFETRQTEFAVEVPTAPAPGLGRYGNTVVGPPGDTTWLRVVRRTVSGHLRFTAYTSQDGRRWVRGGTWQQDQLGSDVRIGLVSMGIDPATPDVTATARFDDVRVWTLRR